LHRGPREGAIGRLADAYNHARPMNVDILALLLVASIGVLIGAVGVGGFLVVPVLVFVQGRPLREAVIAATVSFVGAGIVAIVVVMQGRREPNARHDLAFLAACAPGALAGALLLRVIDATVIGILITLAVGAAGVAELLRSARACGSEGNETNVRGASRRRIATIAFGGLTGTASALTGTSGPLVAMPLLALTGMPIRERIRAGQVAQLPIALTAALVFVSAGDIGLALAASSALALGVGMAVGMRVTPRVAPTALARVAAMLMIATSLAMLATALRR
jgi:hypothetical protein